ncbi:AfsR/SARP family transcriptional regulator [Nonomuraea diastatica]|uniref:Tetratricopeptide repeat protein n=1 Tax=Nonomuraea diastatica TaxID=1848329 RepID=A0A4R4WHD8_9ACTN|nr:BTAD domain-containing putative transcriptional regulator [Nonomuraea diastatica]TDD17761.1 tetratricopeptide repeat protein [Nonomuraea diastatica]
MYFKILGPLSAEREGSEIHLGGSLQRVVLATLLLDANRIVPISRLIEAAWGETPPETARNQIQIRVSSLRRTLGDDGRPFTLFITRPPGYLIKVKPAQLDLADFDELTGRAQQEEPEQAAKTLRRALTLWRGPALSNVSSDLVQTTAYGLNERRLLAHEQCIEFELATGFHQQLVAELRGLVQDNPLRERLHGHLMLALYRSGRQAEALQVFRSYRRMLLDTLGLEPGDELRRLELAILNQEAGLEILHASTRRTPVPKQLESSPSGVSLVGEGTGLRFGILGEVTVANGEEMLPIRSENQRIILAILLARRRRVVSTDRLIDAVRGERPPSSAPENLRSHICEIRQLVGGRIDAVAGGYRLRADADEIDIGRFEALVAQGDYGQALALWRGPAFGPLAEHPHLRVEAARLEGRRLAVTEQHIDAVMAAGRHDEVVARLTQLIAEHPLHERFCGRLMAALYRAGRQADALDAYRQIAARLAGLGIDPGTELQELHQAIRRSDPALELPAGRPLVIPSELPTDLAAFTGREQELVRLRGTLLEDHLSVVIFAISGSGGVGKSALAIHLAHQIVDRYPDGQLYANLQGSTPDATPVDPIDVLGQLLRSLGVAPDAVPVDVEEAAALFRTRTHNRRLLIILDNALDAAQVRPLLPAGRSCAVLITCRRNMSSLEAAQHLPLGPLSEQEAGDLLARLIGAHRSDAEPEAVAEISRLCAYLPLAISIAAARLNSRRVWSLAKLADRLAVEHQRLSELEQGDRALRTSLHAGYRQLDEAHARVFRLCALPGGPDLDTDAAAALLDIPASQAEDHLDDLVDFALLDNPAPGIYRYHDLIRLFAQEQAAQRDPDNERDQALHRLLGFYTATTHNAVTTDDPQWTWPRSLLPRRHPGRTFPHPKAAAAWLFDNVPHLVAAAEWGAHRPESLGLAADLVTGMRWLLYSGVGWARIAPSFHAIIDTAARTGDTRSEAVGLYELGHLSYYRHLLSDAAALLERATDLARVVGDRVLLWQIWHTRGLAYTGRRRLPDAVHALQEAAALAQELRLPAREATTLANLARVHIHAGQMDQAVTVLDQALHAARASGDPDPLAAVRYARGVALRDTGRFHEAARELTDARHTFRALARRTAEGNVLYHLAETYRQADRHAQAIEAAEECLALSREIGDDYNIARALAALGQSHAAQGDHAQGRTSLQEAHEIFARLDATEAAEIETLLTQRLDAEGGRLATHAPVIPRKVSPEPSAG